MRLEVWAERGGPFRPVGLIDTRPGSGEGFTYDEAWLADPAPRPISLSLPLTGERYPARAIRPYFDGLLPEGRARAAASREVRAPSGSYLRLLEALGRECIGAVYVGPGAPSRDGEGYLPLSEGELDAMSRQLVERSSWVSDQTRFSLAGAQPKAALFRGAGGRWRRPVGAAPSTHILKPTHPRFEDAAVNEALCTIALGRLGLDVPEVGVVPTDVPMICARRFDRVVDEGSRDVGGERAPHRLHQEDMAQALGVVPEHKYEEGGRRGYARRVGELLRVASASPIDDLRALWWAVCAGFLVGNCDAHLKNHALLWDAGWEGARLAPLYDVMSTSHYEGLSRDLAMSVGGVRDLAAVDQDAFLREAGALAVPRGWAMGELSRLAAGIEAALEMAAGELERSGVRTAGVVLGRILPGVRERAARVS